MAVLVSSLVEGEYTAPAVAFGLVLLTAVVFDAWLRPFNLWRLLTGDFYIDRFVALSMAGHTCKHVRRRLDAAHVDQGDRKARVLAAVAVEGDYSHSKSTVHNVVTAYHGNGPGTRSSWARNGVGGMGT
jgi:hypothetical protein